MSDNKGWAAPPPKTLDSTPTPAPPTRAVETQGMRTGMFPQLSQVLPNFHECCYHSTTTPDTRT